MAFGYPLRAQKTGSSGIQLRFWEIFPWKNCLNLVTSEPIWTSGEKVLLIPSGGGGKLYSYVRALLNLPDSDRKFDFRWNDDSIKEYNWHLYSEARKQKGKKTYDKKEDEEFWKIFSRKKEL